MITETYNIVTVYIYIISSLVGLGMLGIAIWSLRQLTSQVSAAVKSNSISQLNALLALEQQISERRLRLAEAGMIVTELKNSPDQEKKDSAALRFNEAKENYLNGLDRLCFCVAKGLLSEEDMRLEYRDTIKTAMGDFPDSFTATTPYRNIKKIYELWADK